MKTALPFSALPAGAVSCADHGAVEHVGVRAHWRTVAAEPAADEGASGRRVLLTRDAGLKKREVDVVASVQRQIGDCPCVDEPSQRRAPRMVAVGSCAAADAATLSTNTAKTIDFMGGSSERAEQSGKSSEGR